MCGVEVTFDAHADSVEQRIKVHPDKNDPFSRGSMCPKAAALGPLHYDRSKLRQPVKKVGDDWQPISWQEAYDTVSEKIIAIRARTKNLLRFFSENSEKFLSTKKTL